MFQSFIILLQLSFYGLYFLDSNLGHEMSLKLYMTVTRYLTGTMSAMYNALSDDCQSQCVSDPNWSILKLRFWRVLINVIRGEVLKTPQTACGGNPKVKWAPKNFLSVVCLTWTGIHRRQQWSCHMQRKCQIRKSWSWLILSQGMNFGEYVPISFPWD